MTTTTTTTTTTTAANSYPDVDHDMLPSWLVAAVRDTARGSYQDALISGHESWSGGTLRGRARHYGASYAESRGSLLARIDRAVRLSPAAGRGARAWTEIVTTSRRGVRRARRHLVVWAGVPTLPVIW